MEGLVGATLGRFPQSRRSGFAIPECSCRLRQGRIVLADYDSYDHKPVITIEVIRRVFGERRRPLCPTSGHKDYTGYEGRFLLVPDINFLWICRYKSWFYRSQPYQNWLNSDWIFIFKIGRKNYEVLHRDSWRCDGLWFDYLRLAGPIQTLDVNVSK